MMNVDCLSLMNVVFLRLVDELSEGLSQVNLGEGSGPSLEENSARSRSHTGSQNIEVRSAR